jgi:hypothetical protein
VLIVVGRGARDEEEVDASEEIQSMHGFAAFEGVHTWLLEICP